jgi:hypothetical protein
MIKFVGIALMFISSYCLQSGFELSELLWFVLGLFLVCSQGIFGHLLFMQREKVRAKYRRRR